MTKKAQFVTLSEKNLCSVRDSEVPSAAFRQKLPKSGRVCRSKFVPRTCDRFIRKI